MPLPNLSYSDIPALISRQPELRQPERFLLASLCNQKEPSPLASLFSAVGHKHDYLTV